LQSPPQADSRKRAQQQVLTDIVVSKLMIPQSPGESLDRPQRGIHAAELTNFIAARFGRKSADIAAKNLA
jgi:hypothetical protein